MFQNAKGPCRQFQAEMFAGGFKIAGEAQSKAGDAVGGHDKDNIAGAAIFLASRAGNFNVGSNIVVDGGESVRGVQRAFYAKVWPDFVKLDR